MEGQVQPPRLYQKVQLPWQRLYVLFYTQLCKDAPQLLLRNLLAGTQILANALGEEERGRWHIAARAPQLKGRHRKQHGGEE